VLTPPQASVLFPEHDELQSDDVTLLVVNLSFPQTRNHRLAVAAQKKFEAVSRDFYPYS